MNNLKHLGKKVRKLEDSVKDMKNVIDLSMLGKVNIIPTSANLCLQTHKHCAPSQSLPILDSISKKIHKYQTQN